MEPIHDRMPVILEADDDDSWLVDDDPDALKALLNPYADDELDTFEISTTVTDPANDSPAVVEPTGQPGLGDF